MGPAREFGVGVVKAPGGAPCLGLAATAQAGDPLIFNQRVEAGSNPYAARGCYSA